MKGIIDKLQFHLVLQVRNGCYNLGHPNKRNFCSFLVKSFIFYQSHIHMEELNNREWFVARIIENFDGIQVLIFRYDAYKPTLWLANLLDRIPPLVKFSSTNPNPNRSCPAVTLCLLHRPAGKHFQDTAVAVLLVGKSETERERERETGRETRLLCVFCSDHHHVPVDTTITFIFAAAATRSLDRKTVGGRREREAGIATTLHNHLRRRRCYFLVRRRGWKPTTIPTLSILSFLPN